MRPLVPAPVECRSVNPVRTGPCCQNHSQRGDPATQSPPRGPPPRVDPGVHEDAATRVPSLPRGTPTPHAAAPQPSGTRHRHPSSVRDIGAAGHSQPLSPQLQPPPPSLGRVWLSPACRATFLGGRGGTEPHSWPAGPPPGSSPGLSPRAGWSRQQGGPCRNFLAPGSWEPLCFESRVGLGVAGEATMTRWRP